MNQTANQGPTLLALMQERGASRRGWVEASVEDLSAWAGITTHDVKKVLHQWDRQGLVRFRTRNHGAATAITSIRLTAKGMAYEYSEERMAIATEVQSPEAKITVGEKPKQESSLHRQVRMMIDPEGKMPVDVLEAAVRPIVAERTAVAQQKRLATRAANRAAKKNGQNGHTAAAVPAPEPGPAPLVTKTLLAGLPLLSDLSGRQERLMNAAAAIEADAPDLADSIMARAQDAYTPIEQEVIVLLDRLGIG